MNTNQQDTHPPIATGEHHRQLSSSTGNHHLTSSGEHHRQPSSPMTPTNINAIETNSTAGSRLAAAIGRLIFNIPPTSDQDAPPATTTTTNTLLRTSSDANSSANHTTTTTSPNAPRNNPLHRSISDTTTVDYQHLNTSKKTPLRRSLSDTIEYQQLQQPRKTPRVSSSPQSSTGKQSPQFERLRKVEDMVREIEHRCREIMSEEEQVAEDTKPQEQDECVGVERLKNGDLRFELCCSCGKNFEMLIEHNGYCFYRLT